MGAKFNYISIFYDQSAIPVYFALPKLGNSNLAEPPHLISQVVPLFKEYKTTLLGDREFCSVKLANCLREPDLFFCLSLKQQEFIEVKNVCWQHLNDCGLKPGISLFLPDIKVTNTH